MLRLRVFLVKKFFSESGMIINKRIILGEMKVNETLFMKTYFIRNIVILVILLVKYFQRQIEMASS